VALRDADGQFRELDDVFLELSEKWDSLDKNTQRYIATIAAGSRQQSRFIAMMSDYGRTQELVSAANNSAGASNRQFEKTLESLEAKMKQLKNAWDEFTMGIMNSDVFKFGVTALTKFLGIVNKITDGFGGLGGSLMKISSVIGIFKLGS
jgi:TP901 family phage tail tape measure protein